MAGPWGKLAAVGRRAGDWGEIPPLVTLWAAPVDGLTGFRESLSVSTPAVLGPSGFLRGVFGPARSLPHFLLGHNFTLFLESGPGASVPWGYLQVSGHLPHPLFLPGHSTVLCGALLYPSHALLVLETESCRWPTPGLPTSWTRATGGLGR